MDKRGCVILPPTNELYFSSQSFQLSTPADITVTRSKPQIIPGPRSMASMGMEHQNEVTDGLSSGEGGHSSVKSECILMLPLLYSIYIRMKIKQNQCWKIINCP